jgi:hypothetical protein
MHFCADELLAITMALPFIGGFVAVARARWRRWRKKEPLQLPPPDANELKYREPEHHPRCAINYWHPVRDIESPYPACTCKVCKADDDGTYRSLH